MSDFISRVDAHILTIWFCLKENNASDPNKSTLGDVVTSLTVVILIVALLYAVFFIILPDPGKTST